jgi:hypothetical protein
MRVTHTPFSTPVRVIGRDAELTLALIKELEHGQKMFGVNKGWLHRVLDTIKMFLK